MMKREINEDRDEHDSDEEIRELLLENLKVAKETRSYARTVHRWQQLGRAWTFFYWTVLIGLAVLGYYYAFPYLQVAREEFGAAMDQFSAFIGNEPTPADE